MLHAGRQLCTTALGVRDTRTVLRSEMMSEEVFVRKHIKGRLNRKLVYKKYRKKTKLCDVKDNVYTCSAR